MSDAALDPSNPFAAPSALPHGLPPFDRIAVEHYAPALDAGMAEQRAEVEAVAADDGEPTFAGVLEALERSGALLRRVTAAFGNLLGSDSSDALRDLQDAYAPRLSAHADATYLDRRLFAKVEALHERRRELGLDPEQVRLVERYHLDFVRAGAALDEPGAERLRALNGELSSLSSTFTRRLLEGTNEAAVLVEDRDALDGLSDDAVEAAAERARARGHASGHLLPLVLPTGQPVLSSLRDRSLRERVHRASVGRGLEGEHATRDLVTRMVHLRAERAALLGFSDHAAYVTADQTAGSTEAVLSMLGDLVGPAVANARAEAAELEQLLRSDGHDGPLQPWDWAFYADRVRRERYAVDTAALRPYFELDRVLRDGVLHAASALYGLRFTPRPDLPVYHPDVRTFEVHDADGAALGLVLLDWFARDSKRGGAWMSSYVTQSHLLGTKPVVVVNLNVPRPPDGEPALMTTDEVDTAFHEFGHALHGLLSDVRYPRFSGTSVPRDFVEFPSQVNEMWAWEPEVLARYAVHVETGEALPEELRTTLLASRSYGEGFATTEYLAAAVLDLEWHRRPASAGEVPADDVEGFEAEALERWGLRLDEVPPRYRTAYFQHLFGSGYSAAYYSYIWSEVLDADAVDWFRENGGLVRANGDAFRAGLLSRGGAVDPMEAFRAVRGRDPRLEPLLDRRGLRPAA